jgi:hypothetical protein
VSPILTRPVREQLEHDRVIRLLQARYKRKHEVVINPGAEQNQSVMSGELPVYPDLLLYSVERGRRLQGTVEVETGESVNQLEALAEWGVFARLGVPLHLYVPATSVEAVRRLCAEHQIAVGEIWTFHPHLDELRFTMVYRAPGAAAGARAGRSAKSGRAGTGKPSPPRKAKPVRPKPARRAAAKKTPAAKKARRS